MKVHLANKILSGFSTILSLFLVSTCAWILTSLLIKKYGNGQNDCKTDNWKHGLRSQCNSTNYEHPSFNDEHSNSSGNYHEAVVIENTELTPRSFWTEFDEMNSQFFIIITICLSCVIVASLTQFICSMVIISSTPNKMATRSRRVVVILFVTFVVFLLCLLWPSAYKRNFSDDDDMMHTISTLNSSAMDFIMSFEWKHLFKDLTLYFIGLLINVVFLFFYMVMTCCLLRCNDSYQYDV